MIIGSCNFMGNSPSTFGEHRNSSSKDKMVLVCHVTLQDYMTRASYGFTVTRPSS